MSETRILSVSEATRRGVAGLVKDAVQGDVVVQRHGTPVAAIVSMAHLEHITQVSSDLLDAALVLARSASDTGPRVGLDEALAQFGLDRAELEYELAVERGVDLPSGFDIAVPEGVAEDGTDEAGAQRHRL